MATNFHFCDDCGTRNTTDSKHCKECGAKIHVLFQTPTLALHDQVEDAAQQARLTQFLDMAFWHTEAGNTDAAVRACKAALTVHPHSTTAHSLLGSLYEKKGDDSQAIAHLEQVLALNPDSEADRAKLEQIRSGVHTQPVKPSRLYQWLPPALAHFRVAGLAEKITRMPAPDMTLMPTRPNPALAAGAAAVLVLACGLFMIKPPPQAPATITPAGPIIPNAIGRSAFAAGPTNEATPNIRVSALSAPVVLGPPRPGTPLLPPGSVLPSVASTPRPDPFVDTRSPLLTATTPATTRRGGRTARASRGTGGGLHALPALSLGGSAIRVPQADQGPLPPAPVHVPDAVRAAKSPYAGVITHTVAVKQFNGTPSELNHAGAGASGGFAVSQPSPPAPVSHIEITIDRGADDASSRPAADNTPPGETYQQTAFSLQQQGDYRHARATYEKAVHAYQSQIAAGRNPEAARRGLEACQTGLQICQQSQQ